MRGLTGSAVVALALAGALTLLGPTAAARAKAAPMPAAEHVVVMLAPFLTWNDLSPERTPALWKLAGDGAIGNMNAKTAEYGWPTLAGGVLTISASRWAIGPTGGPIDADSLAAARSANASSLAPPALGALGGAVHAGGGRTVAVGESDTTTASTASRFRPAELVATDANGIVDAVIADPPVDDPAAAFGLRTDSALLREAIGASIAPAVGTAPAPTLVVIDTGDLSRAHDATAAPLVYRQRHADAVARLDAAVEQARAALGPDDLLLVVPAATDKGWYMEPDFGPLIIFGRGSTGEITSASTRRPGLAINLDIAPTVLAAMGIATPAEMLGKPLGSRSDAPPLATRIAALARYNTWTGAIDQLRDAWFLRWFCYIAMGAIALATLLAFLPPSPADLLGEVALIAMMSVLPAGWLMFLLAPRPQSLGTAVRALAVSTLAVAAVALLLRLFSHVRVSAPLFLTALASLVICADQWLGHPIESGLFSYSVRAGWRYYGMGNEGAAILTGASLAAVGLAASALAEKPARLLTRYGLPLVGAVVLITSAAPFSGANAGVAVWGLVAFAVAWAAMNGVRFTWRAALWTALEVVAVVAAFSAIDLMRGGGGTHLARFASEILRGDVSAVRDLVWRKLENNLAYLPQTTYTGLAIAMALSLGALWFGPRRPLVSTLEPVPAYAAAVLGIVVGGVFAWATEDSGIVMPALMLLAGAVPALLLALRQRTSRKIA